MPLEFLYGLLNLPWWGYVAVAAVMVHITLIGVTLYLHRDQAHRAVDLHPALRHFFRFWLWMTTGMVTREWVAVHRKHHALCEREGDPHSPRVFGLKKVLLEGAELYREAARDPEVVEKYGRGAPNDWLERNLYARHPWAGITLTVVLNLLFFGVPGIIIIAVQMLAIPVLAAGVINGLGHAVGYRNFECDDAATNLVPWAFVVCGEELHNNHHAFPSSAKFSAQPWEFDLGWLYLRGLSAVGLAEVRRTLPTPVIDPSAAERETVDVETVRAVIVNRMHVLRAYGRQVTLPVLQLEQARARGDALLKRARTLLIRQPALLDSDAKSRLTGLLERRPNLRTVVEFREQLQTLWSGAAASNDKLVADLRDWIARAEASGIGALQDFARQLRAYSTGSPATA
jgi:stearoyl-CoA desaturase (delta-9 desaturase)